MGGQKKSISLRDRIFAKTKKLNNGCIEWFGYSPGGYGRIRWGGKRIAVHRAIYEMRHGDIGDLCVCHTCDNPRCVNIVHLFSGTRADNNADKTRKGRQAKGPEHGVKGEKSHFSKLTEVEVKEIRAMSGMTQCHISKIYGVSQAQISNIINRSKWGHI